MTFSKYILQSFEFLLQTICRKVFELLFFQYFPFPVGSFVYINHSLRADFKHFQVGKVCASALRILYSFQLLVISPIDISTNQERFQKSFNIVSQLQD